MNKYQNIFTPLTIKNMTIRNRVAMPPMGTNYGGAMGDFTEEHVQYYEKRAKGGTGLIIVENACVDFPVGSNGTTQINDGATTLADGIKTFNEEGIEKICNYINGDAKDLTTRVEKLTELSKEYNNFTMLDGENLGEVKFIMIIDAVKQQTENEQNKEEAIVEENK